MDARRRGSAADDAGLPRRCETRICLWPRGRTTRDSPGNLSRHTDDSGEEEWLGSDQHAKGLETHLPVRQITTKTFVEERFWAHRSLGIRSNEFLGQTNYNPNERGKAGFDFSVTPWT